MAVKLKKLCANLKQHNYRIITKYYTTYVHVNCLWQTPFRGGANYIHAKTWTHRIKMPYLPYKNIQFHTFQQVAKTIMFSWPRPRGSVSTVKVWCESWEKSRGDTCNTIHVRDLHWWFKLVCSRGEGIHVTYPSKYIYRHLT